VLRPLIGLWPILTAFLPLLVAALFGDDLVAWTTRVQSRLGATPWSLVLAISLTLPIVPALLFNQVRLALICILLIAIGFGSDPAFGLVSADARRLLIPIFAMQVTTLTLLRERGLLTRFGLIRLAVAFAPLIALWAAPPAALQWLQHMSIPDGLFWSPPAGMATPWLWLLPPALSVLLLLRLRGTEFPVIAPPLAGVILLAVIGLDAPSPMWSGLPPRIACALSISQAGLLLLYAAYRLSWGRAYIDSLTGLPGRRALEEQLAKLAGVYTLAMVDVDHFKKFNDRFGHDVGDDVLRMVGAELRDGRAGSAFRYGGEEFTLVFPGRDAKAVEKRLNDLRERIASRVLVVRQDRNRKKKTRGHKVGVTASFGAASRNERRRSPAQVLKAADSALYRAKKTGRNKVVVV
jgi:diguanylate cyclase (GGDEF)-like protein